MTLVFRFSSRENTRQLLYNLIHLDYTRAMKNKKFDGGDTMINYNKHRENLAIWKNASKGEGEFKRILFRNSVFKDIEELLDKAEEWDNFRKKSLFYRGKEYLKSIFGGDK